MEQAIETDRRGDSDALAGSASRGALVTFGGQAVRALVQFGGIVVLARLLSPQDYGLVAMVTAIIGVGEVLRDFGLFSAAIQARELSRQQRDNLFWINTGIGLALTAAVCAAAAPIAALYGDPRLEPLAYVLSATFLLNGMSTQFRAHLIRDLLFPRLYAAELTGQILALTVAVVLASSGIGYWALAVQQVGQAVIVFGMLVVLARWRPGGVHRGVPMRAFLSYAGSVVGAQLLAYVSRNVDSFVIGHRFGAGALGLYNRAFQLVSLPLMQLQAPATRVALPVLSRLQDTRERFNDFVRVGQSALLTLVALAFTLFASQAAAVVEIALGQAWLPTVPLLQILLVGGFFQAAGYAGYWIFLAKGLTRANLHFALCTRPLMVGAILLGSLWGVTGVAAAYAISTVLLWPIGMLWLSRITDVDMTAMALNGLRTFVVFATAGGISALVVSRLDLDTPLLCLLVGWPLVLVVVGGFVAGWSSYRRDVRSLLRARSALTGRDVDVSRGAPVPVSGPVSGPSIPVSIPGNSGGGRS